MMSGGEARYSWTVGRGGINSVVGMGMIKFLICVRDQGFGGWFLAFFVENCSYFGSN